MEELEDVPSGRWMRDHEYLEALQCSPYQTSAEWLLQGILEPVIAHNRGHGLVDADPELRIVNDATPQAEGIPGVILVTHGMVMHCLTVAIADWSAAFDVAHVALFTDGDPLRFQKVMFTWVVLHEHMHAARKRQALLEAVGDDELTQQAVEYDADLCAIASLYRWMGRQVGGYLPDLELKKLIACSIFWGLRTLTTFCKRSTHSPVGVRLAQTTGKLALLRPAPEPGQLPDISMALEQTREEHRALIETFFWLEKSFQALPRYLPEYGDVAADMAAALADGSYKAAMLRWDELRFIAAELRSPADLALELRAAELSKSQ